MLIRGCCGVPLEERQQGANMDESVDRGDDVKDELENEGETGALGEEDRSQRGSEGEGQTDGEGSEKEGGPEGEGQSDDKATPTPDVVELDENADVSDAIAEEAHADGSHSGDLVFEWSAVWALRDAAEAYLGSVFGDAASVQGSEQVKST